MDWTGAGACPSADGWMGRHRGWIGKWSGCRSGKAREQETNFANTIEENPLILQTPSRKHFLWDRGERSVKQNRLHRQTWGRSPRRRCTHRRLRLHRRRGDLPHVCRCSLFWVGWNFMEYRGIMHYIGQDARGKHVKSKFLNGSDPFNSQTSANAPGVGGWG